MSNLSQFVIVMEADGEKLLFLHLSADGLAKRGGNGKLGPRDPDLYVAQTDGAMFRELAPLAPREWLQRESGEYADPNPRGLVCTLTVAFADQAGEWTEFRFGYGSESAGPPGDLTGFVVSAIQATEPWYRDQQLMVDEATDRR